MFLKVLGLAIIPNQLHWQTPCRMLPCFNSSYHPKPRIIQPYALIPAGRHNSSSSVQNVPKSDTDTMEPVSLQGIKKHLKNGNFEMVDGNCCLKTVCPVCEPTKDRTKSVYINKTTGAVMCLPCQRVQHWSTVEKLFIQSTTTKRSKELEVLREQFVKNKVNVEVLRMPPESTLVHDLSSALVERVLNHLNLEMFPVSVFESLGVTCDPNTNTLYFPLQDADAHMVGYKTLSRQNDIVVETTFPDSNSFGVLFAGVPKLSGKEANAVVVLNVPDLLALSMQKLNTAIVCLPHGYKSLPQECLPALERFSRLTLWFHNDTASWDTARNFAKKLNEKRCVFVRPTESHPSPFVAAQERLDVRAIIGSAQPVLHKAITTFASLRQDVLSEIQNVDKVQGVKWSRFPILNKLLKGHRKGELTILTGPTGCGKTTFMSEYSLDLTQKGVNTLWGSFEIRNTRLASTLLRQLSGHPFDEQLHEFDRWANEFEKLPMYFMTFHGQQSIKVVMDTIEHAQYVHDIHHVIIDNVQFMMGTSDESKHVDRFWRQDAIIAAFRTFATKKNCHVTLVIHPRKERDTEDLTTSSIFGGAKATQEADNVLIIQDKRLTAIRGKKYLQIAKNRYSGDLGIMPMEFDKAGLSYAQKRKKPENETPSCTNAISSNQAIM